MSVGEDVEGRQPLYTVDDKINWCYLYGKHYGGSTKIKNRTMI